MSSEAGIARRALATQLWEATDRVAGQVGAVSAAVRCELVPGLPFGPGPTVHGHHTKANALDLDIPLSSLKVRTWKANLGFSVVARFWTVPYNCVAQLISSVVCRCPSILAWGVSQLILLGNKASEYGLV